MLRWVQNKWFPSRVLQQNRTQGLGSFRTCQRSLDFEFHASQFEAKKNKKDFDVCDFAKESVKFDFSKKVF